MTRSHGIGIAAAFIALTLLTPIPAHAYVDPGYGTLLWQALMSAAFGAVFFGRRMIASALSRLRFGRRPPDGGSTSS